ncbi:unnamed protein product, partial [Prorocentrum cordatum]
DHEKSGGPRVSMCKRVSPSLPDVGGRLGSGARPFRNSGWALQPVPGRTPSAPRRCGASGRVRMWPPTSLAPAMPPCKRQAHFASAPRGDASDPEAADFEWICQDLDRLVALLRPRLPAAGPVLHPGCGMSQLPARLAACTGLHVLSLDGSPSCVAAMRRAHAGEGALAWELCDVRQLDELPAARAARAACAVEKGCLDALLCDSDEAAARYLAALARVLPPGGRLLLVSTLRAGRHRHFTPAFRVVEVVPLSEDLSGGSLYVCERLAAPATALDELD